ncbi:tyrosine-type recombinase/integrase [Lacticaseibacillus yichunensis]|uniref:Tyrosine-type recombinase/integrase n=1 Tax=Lacticaseibacillus yichunensis TaxID=2486015 RepID=A0ABW4CM11_9LACO|nr:tyrosine-type recombinase/integrase [Lacticaseibacillus yichunensis]
MRKWTPLPRHLHLYSYETHGGTRYAIRRGCKDSEGNRVEFTRSGFRSWRDADKALKEFEARLVSGHIDPFAQRNITVGQYFDLMLARNERLGNWRISTIKSKQSYFDKHFKDRFGSVPLGSITRTEYQTFIDDKVVAGYRENTINAINALMQLIMNDAEKNDVIDKNRLRGVQIVGAKQARPVDLTREQYKTFMTAAAQLLDRYHLTMLYLLSLGERREELAGLQFSSFEKADHDGQPYYKITYKVSRTTYEPQGGKLKTPSSYRSNYVTGEIVDMIDYALQYAKNVILQHHREVTPDTFVYVNVQTGMPVYPSNVNRDLFAPVAKETGIRLRPHMLRHYFATQALEDGLPDMSVMHWLGHKSMDMTNAYTRPTEEGALHVINSMNSKLFGGSMD